MTNLILFLFIVFTQVFASAQDMQIITTRESGSVLSDSALQQFKARLDNRITIMRSRIPNLFLETPGPHTKIGSFIMQAFYPAPPVYKNRDVECAFIDRLISQNEGTVKVRIQKLTANGSNCIVGDLPKNLWLHWTTEWMDLLWTDKWIRNDSGNFSLEDLIIQKIGTENYTRPTFKIAINEQFDGYGAGFSKAVSPQFDLDPVLSRFKKIGQLFNPDQTQPFTLLGDDISTLLTNDSPYGNAGLVRTDSEIYISPAWPISSLVELLVHEYGHVLQAEQVTTDKWDMANKILYRKSNGICNEGFAEALTEMLLADIFIQHPETEVFHLAKLRLFAEIRPSDKHLVGAAVLSPLFFNGQQDFLGLLDLARTESFSGYLKNFRIDTLSEGTTTQDSIRVFFKD